MMAITTSNSISVNPFEYGYFVFILKKAVKKCYSYDQAWQALFLPPFSVLGARFYVETRILWDLQDHLLILMICVHLRAVSAARAWASANTLEYWSVKSGVALRLPPHST
jgi:hypothetical protein